jgi:hypothetical protein
MVVIFGFIIGAFISYFLFQIFSTNVAWEWQLLVSLGSGIVGGVIFYFFYHLAIFMIGASLGCLLSLFMIKSLWVYYSFQPSELELTKVLCYIIIGISSVVTGSITVKFEKVLVIITTAFIGGYFIVLSILLVLGVSFSTFISNLASLSTTSSTSVDPIFLALIWCLAWLTGVIFQFFTTRNKSHSPEKTKIVVING